jgi:hypothetical protein
LTKVLLHKNIKKLTIIELIERKSTIDDSKLNNLYLQFNDLLNELKKHKLPQKVTKTINQNVEELNTSVLMGKELNKRIKNNQTIILAQLDKELKIVPKKHSLVRKHFHFFYHFMQPFCMHSRPCK